MRDETRPLVCPLCGSAPAPATLRTTNWRPAFVVLTLMGGIMACAGTWIATQTLPRFARVQADWGFTLPAETNLILRSGALQPIPGCLLMIGGLLGVLRRRSGRRLFSLLVAVFLAGFALLTLDLLALLLPEMVLV